MNHKMFFGKIIYPPPTGSPEKNDPVSRLMGRCDWLTCSFENQLCPSKALLMNYARIIRIHELVFSYCMTWDDEYYQPLPKKQKDQLQLQRHMHAFSQSSENIKITIVTEPS